MTGNKLKIIACLSMLIDHIGYLLFPKLLIFRYIGRLAMPLFAFLIAEGCLHTRSRLRYFLHLFLLGIVCQAVQIGEQLTSDSFDRLFLNILLTFSLSVLLCFAILRVKECRNTRNILLLLLVIGGAVFLCCVLHRLLPIPFELDYGIYGVCLPAIAVLFSGRYQKAAAFSAGLLLYCIFVYDILPFVWFSLFAIPFIFAYNGKRGTNKLKYAFYIFYPAHFAVLYLVERLFF